MTRSKNINILTGTVVELQLGQSWDEEITITMPRIAWCAILTPAINQSDLLSEIAGAAAADAVRGDPNAKAVEPTLREQAENMNKAVATIGIALYPDELADAKDKAYPQPSSEQ